MRIVIPLLIAFSLLSIKHFATALNLTSDYNQHHIERYNDTQYVIRTKRFEQMSKASEMLLQAGKAFIAEYTSKQFPELSNLLLVSHHFSKLTTLAEQAKVGDIISCIIQPNINGAKHYRVKITETHLAAFGAATSNLATTAVDDEIEGVLTSNYIHSKDLENVYECALAPNSLIQTHKDVLQRYNAVAKLPDKYYHLYTCNCQHVAIYIAYGYTDESSMCLGPLFSHRLTRAIINLPSFPSPR